MNQGSFSGDYSIDKDDLTKTIKINDSTFVDVLYYVKGSGRLVLEKKTISEKNGCLFIIASFIAFYASAFFISFLSNIVSVYFFPGQPPIPLVFLFVFMLFAIFIILIKIIKETLVKKDVIDRVIMDKDRGIIRFETEKKGKSKLNAQYNTSVVNYVKVVVYRRNKMGINLDFHPNTVAEPFNASQIIGYAEASDNKEILKLAHRIGELLGVPVIEKR